MSGAQKRCQEPCPFQMFERSAAVGDCSPDGDFHPLTETNDVHTRARAPVRRVDWALDLPGGGDARGVAVAAGCPHGATGQAGLSAHPAATAATAAFQVRLLAPHTSKIPPSR